MEYRRAQIKQNEERYQNLNNAKSLKQRPNPPLSQEEPISTNNPGPPFNRVHHTGANYTPVLPRVPAPIRPSPQAVTQPPPSNLGQHSRNFSNQTIQDSRSKPLKRPHPINPSPPGQAMYPTNLKYSNHPPPNQAHYPQSSYPPYPQSFFTTPPPGDGPQFAWSTGSRTQTAGLTGTSTVQQGLTGSTPVQTGFNSTRTRQAELSGYPQQWATTGVTDY